MNFDFILIENTTRKRILTKETFDIFEKIKNIWEFIKKKLVTIQESQKRQTDKTRKNSSNYKIKDLVWLFIRNIKTNKSFKKLNHKMIDFYKIIKILKNACQLNLSISMKIHNSFHISLLILTFTDSLTDQIQFSSSSVIINEEKKYEVDDILNNCYHYNKLQYKVSWINHLTNEVWYSVENFDNAKKIVVDYHTRYSAKSESTSRRDEAHITNAIIWINDTSILIEKKLIKTRQFLKQTKQITKNILIKMNERYQTKDKKKRVFLEKKKTSSIERKSA
jgi:hypothetical protein